MINFAQDVLGYKMMTSVYMCAHRLHLGSKYLAEWFINCYCTFGKATAFAAAPPPWGVGTLWRRRSSFCRTSSCGTIGSNYVCHLLNECVHTVTNRYRYVHLSNSGPVHPSRSTQQPAAICSLTYVPAVFGSVPRCLESLPLSAEQLSLYLS